MDKIAAQMQTLKPKQEIKPVETAKEVAETHETQSVSGPKKSEGFFRVKQEQKAAAKE